MFVIKVQVSLAADRHYGDYETANGCPVFTSYLTKKI